MALAIVVGDPHLATMLRNYLKTALRHLLKHQVYVLINVLGLGVGMACCLLILLDIQYELSFESFHHRADRIHRLNWGGLGWGALQARQLTEEVPEVEAVVRFRSFWPVLTRGENQFYQHITFADEDVFDVFDFPLVRGDPATVLREPNSMVLSQDLAHRLFGDEDPVGQTILWDNTFPYTVTGVLRNVQRNTHYWVESLGSFTTVVTQPQFGGLDWDYFTYVLLREGATDDGDAFAGRILDFYRRHVGELPPDVGVPSLTPLQEIHLSEPLYSRLRSLGAVGVIILLMACVNYTNLATARSASRVREVGIRKSVGAGRHQLVWQFLSESTVMAFAALVLAAAMVWVALPGYRAFTGKPLTFDPWGNPSLSALVGALALAVGVLGGAYPALFLAGLRPVAALRGEGGGTRGRALLRRSLVISQFLVAAILLTATMIVHQQLEYVRATDLGIDRERVLTIRRHSGEVTEKLPVLRDGFLADPRVTGFAVSSDLPGGGLPRGTYRASGQHEEREAGLLGVDAGFLVFYGLELLAGRDFEDHLESGVCIVNERLARDLGFASPEHAVGAPIHWRAPPDALFYRWDTDESYEDKEGVVVGVVGDVHYRSLHSPIEPLILFPEISWQERLSIRVAASDVPGAMAHLERVWDRTLPTLPFNPEFLDDRFAGAYRAEVRLGTTVGAFASLAVFVTCLGVFGLGSLTIARRTREIGVRKSLGASTEGIVLLLAAEPVRLALLACLAAAPVTWYAMGNWLQAFAYRIDLGPGVFLLGGCGVLFVAWLAVAPLAARAGRTAPVEALRCE